MFGNFRNYNRNVKLAMVSSIFTMSSFGLLMSAILSIFILNIANGSTLVLGFVSFFGGLMLLIGIFPAGLIADKFSRKLALRIGVVFVFIGFFFLCLSNTVIDIYISFGIFNIGNAFIRPSRDAMLADSVVNNQREEIYGELFFLQRVSNGVGPLVAVFLFYFLGDNWQIGTMKEVLSIGLISLLIGSIIMWFMDDKHSLGSESESTHINPLIDTNIEEKSGIRQFLRENNMALFIVLLGLIIGIGAGMTVRFFPVFFKQDYNLPPTMVNIIYFFVALITGFMAIIVTKYVNKFGKIQSIIFVQVVAIISLFIIAIIPPLSILIPIFLIRGSFMNSSQPVKNAMVMDLVPKRRRGVFQSLQVLSERFFWSFSAGMGGLILNVTNNSYPVLFITTASIYIVGTLPFLLLLDKLPNNKYQALSSTPVVG